MADAKKDAAAKEPAKEQAQDAAPEVGQMKRGDYMIHVYVEQARQLKCPEGQTIDPIIEIQVMNEKKYTTAKDDIGSTGLAIWNEHLFFEPKNVSVEDIEQAKIQIKLLDKGYFKDAMVGAYDFDVAYIYFMPKHALMHQWLALSNPSSPNFNEVAGYLKLSITIAATGDEQVQITEDQSSGDNESIMMPPSIRPSYKQLRFKIFRAEKLPNMDMNLLGKGGSIDAYLTCDYLGQKLKSKTITQKDGGAINWNQEFLIPVQLPVMSGKLVMKLFDEDKINDEIVGSLLFNLKEYMNQKNGLYFWKNLYGAHLGYSGENTNLMNSNPDVASNWKGRVLMQVTAETTDKPTCLLQDLDELEIEKAQPYFKHHEFEVIAEVGQGISLPTSGDKYKVVIRIADLEMKTNDPVMAENSYNRWSMRFKQQTWVAPYQDVYDIGKVFVYLMSGDKPVCYWTDDIEKFMEPNPKWTWIEMINDLSVGKVTEPHKAGLLSIKLSIHDKTKDGPISFDQFDAWKKPPAKRLNLKTVRAYIFQCRDLPAADADGQSDPYIKIWDTSNAIKKTRIIYDNCNPMFFETLELLIETNEVADMPPFVFDVYDHDTLGDDFICRSLIPIADCHFSEGDDIPKPKWHDCKLKRNAPACGQILVSFSIVIDDFNFKTPLKHMRIRDQVETPEFVIDINILGLRNLQSVGILPVKKAFIVFNLKSLVPPEDGTAIDNIKTQPSAAGANPTINTLISFKLQLPRDPLFCPKLSCTVHDYIFKGLSQPMIGSFVVPIGNLVHKLTKEREDEIRAIEKDIEELDKIIQGNAITSYNIQQPNLPLETFSETVGKDTLQALQKAKSSLKGIDSEMKTPLLLASSLPNNQLFEEEKEGERRNSQGGGSYVDVRAGSNAGSRKGSFQMRSPTSARRITPKSITGQNKTPQNALKQETFDKFQSGMKGQLLAETKEALERQKRELEDNRKRDLEDFKNQQEHAAAKNVVMPQYEQDKRLMVYREVNPPPDSLFMGLGWDEDDQTKRRHYRRYYPDELENVREVMPVETPFDQFDIKKGQSRGASKSWFSWGGHKEDSSGALSTEQVVGRFKGIVTVQSEEDLRNYQERKAELIHELKKKLNILSLKALGVPIHVKMEKIDSMEGRQWFQTQLNKMGAGHLNITQHIADLESDETLKRMLMKQTKCIVRCYMISAYDLASRDNGSFSDPYLIINLGNKTYNERSSYQLDNPDPEFHKYYDFEATFPGCPPLNINVMDYDDIFGDDSIGTTSVDLEDRFFSPEWQSISNKPIEFRQLYHPSSSVSQGVVKMWVEIIPTTIPISEVPVWDTVPKPPEDFEVRVCVFDTVGIKMMDAEGTSDVYCRAFFDSKKEVKETDTHYRCQNGKASFNYRLIYQLQHPRKDYTFTLQAYDRDFFKSNDIIGDMVLDLKEPIMDCALSGKPICVNKMYWENYLKPKGFKFEYKDLTSFYIPMRSRNSETGVIEENGKVRIQIDILPKAMAESNKVGAAREEPNHSPFLPPPVGRLQFSLNPWKMFQQLVGPALRRKIYCYCCLAVCIALCVFLMPLIIGNLISALITKAVGL